MEYKNRVIKHLKLLFSREGYNTAFNKDYHGFEDCIIPKENRLTTGEGYFLSIGYIIIAASIILFIASLIFTGSKALIYIPLIFTIPIVLVLIMSTIKIRRKVDKYRKDKGTSGLLFLSFLFISSSCMVGIFLGLIENNILSGVGFIIMTSYPWLLMLCRINVFSDDSIPRYEGPKMSIELGPGYVPLVYWLLSCQIGFAVTKVGFKNLQSSLAYGDPSLFFCIISIILGLISQTIVVSPDMIDRVVPVDMRMKKGYILLVIIAVILVFGSWIVMGLI
jgi:hypothetical protein